MNQYELTITGKSSLSWSRYYVGEFPKGDKETSRDHEARTWMNRVHVNVDGNIFIPPMSIKKCLQECAQFLSIQIPGKGKATYTKHFLAGIMVTDPMVIGATTDDIKPEWFLVPSNGRAGDGTRVEKCFPRIDKWGGTTNIYVLDETITQDVLEKHIIEAGNLIGLGRFRPRNGGFYGRFNLTKLQKVS